MTNAEELYKYAKIAPYKVRDVLKKHPEEEAAFYELLAANNEADLYEYFTGKQLMQPSAMLYASIDEEGNIEKGGSATNADGYTDSFWAKFNAQGELVDSSEYGEGPTTQWPEAYIPDNTAKGNFNQPSQKSKSNVVLIAILATAVLAFTVITDKEKN